MASLRAIARLICAAVLLAAGAASASAADAAPRVLILLSGDTPPYRQALEGFSERLKSLGVGATLDEVRLRADATENRALINAAGRRQPDVAVAIGTQAVQAARSGEMNAPIVATMILDDRELRGVSNATGVLLRFPVQTELQWVRRFLPDAKNVAVVYHADENGARVERARLAAEQIGFRIQAHPVDSPRDLPGELDDVARNADVLWGIPDQVVMTPQTAKPILLFSFRNRIPLVGLSAAWVKAGALFALERDYRDIGAQTAELAAKVLSGVDPQTLPIARPRNVLYVVNLKTARQMKLSLPGDLIKGAAEVIE